MVKSYPSPVPLVTVVDERYALCEEGERFLKQLDEDLVFGTVVIAGRYRSGKSFLLNRGLLEAPPRKGFATGNSVNSCTRGIWIYPTPLETEDKQGCFLVLDTEGTASMEANAEHDAKLIGISLALASVFVFNSSGAIDETSLSDLATLTTVAQSICEDNDCFSPPELIWVLRDFTLQLSGDAGEEITPDEYLERALSEEKYGKASTRAALKAFFLKRRLVPLVRPCLEESQLQKLNTLSNAALRPQFLKQIEDFRTSVKRAASVPKQLGGLPLNGTALLRVAAEAVRATNLGRTPAVHTIFDFLHDRKLQEARREAVAALRDQAEVYLSSLPRRSLRLSPPPPPAFLRVQKELEDFVVALAEEARTLEAQLESSNQLSTAKFLEDWRRKLARDERLFETSVVETFRRLPERFLEASVCELHQEACSGAREERAALEQRLLCESSLARRAEEAAQELRTELEEAALHAGDPSARLRDCEVLEQALQDLRQEAQRSLGLLATSKDEVLQELKELRSELGSERSHGEERAAADGLWMKELQEELQTSRAAETGLEAQLASRAQNEELSVHASLEEMRLDFTEIVKKCELRTAQEIEQRNRALQEREAYAQQLAEGYEDVQRIRAELEDRREAYARDFEESKRKQTQELLQRKQIMSDAYAEIAQDSQRCRESSIASERKLMLVEIERDSLKRRIDALDLEGEDFRKLKRQYEELRYKSASMEASLQASDRMNDLRKSQLLSAEEELQKLRSSCQQRELDLQRRTVMLELQLQACGVDAAR